MQVYTYSEARQKLAAVLEQAETPDAGQKAALTGEQFVMHAVKRIHVVGYP